MRRMIPQKLIDAIKALLPFSQKVEYVGDQVKINADVTAKTLKQSEANYSAPLTISFSNDNFEIVGSPFSKIEVVNGEIHIIFSGLVHNKAETSQSGYLSNARTEVPDEIGSKIFAVNGSSLDEEPSATPIENVIRIVLCGTRIGGTGVTSSVLVNLVHTAKGVLSLSQTGSFTIPADDYLVLSFEVNLSLF